MAELRKMMSEILYEDEEKLKTMNDRDLLDEVQSHFKDLANTKDSEESLREYIKDLEIEKELLQEKYDDLEQHFINLPGYDNYDDVDLESLKQSQ